MLAILLLFITFVTAQSPFKIENVITTHYPLPNIFVEYPYIYPRLESSELSVYATDGTVGLYIDPPDGVAVFNMTEPSKRTYFIDISIIYYNSLIFKQTYKVDIATECAKARKDTADCFFASQGPIVPKPQIGLTKRAHSFFTAEWRVNVVVNTLQSDYSNHTYVEIKNAKTGSIVAETMETESEFLINESTGSDYVLVVDGFFVQLFYLAPLFIPYAQQLTNPDGNTWGIQIVTPQYPLGFVVGVGPVDLHIEFDDAAYNLTFIPSPDTPRPIPRCENIAAHIEAERMPRFQSDNSAYAKLVFSNASVVVFSSHYNWIVSVDNENWISIEPYEEYTFKLRAGVNYKATVVISRILTNTTMTNFMCSVETPILRALPAISLTLIAPVQPIYCVGTSDLYIFKIAAINREDNTILGDVAIPVPTTTKNMATIVDFSNDNDPLRTFVVYNGGKYDDLILKFEFDDDNDDIYLADLAAIVHSNLVTPPLRFSVETIDFPLPVESLCEKRQYSLSSFVRVENETPFETKASMDWTIESMPRLLKQPLNVWLDKLEFAGCGFAQKPVFITIPAHVTANVSYANGQFHIESDRAVYYEGKKLFDGDNVTQLTSSFVTIDKCQIPIDNSFAVNDNNVVVTILSVTMRLATPSEILVVTNIPTVCTLDKEYKVVTRNDVNLFYVKRMGTYVVTCGQAQRTVHVGIISPDNTPINQTLKCPVAMHFGQAFNYVHIKSPFLGDEDLLIWHEESGESVHVDPTRGIYTVPRIGTYVWESINSDVSLFNANSPFVLTEPDFKIDVHTQRLPSCFYAFDGAIRLDFLDITGIEIMILNYVYYYNGTNAANTNFQIEYNGDESDVIIYNLPYLQKMTLEIVIANTPCRFTKEVSLLPEVDFNIDRLVYIPSCRTDYHTVVAVDSNGKQITTGNFAWKIDNKLVWDQDTLYIKPQQQAVLSISLRITVETCISESQLRSLEMVAVPTVEIDRTASLPVFCPLTDDAQVVARFNSKLGPQLAIWSDSQGRALNHSVKINGMTSILKHASGGETYTVTYEINGCRASDSFYVSPKPRYLLYSHIETVPSLDGNGKIYIDMKSVESVEITSFTGDMLKSADRRFLIDMGDGKGNVELDGLPNGYVVEVAIPYPLKYASGAPFCREPFRLTTGKMATLPEYATFSMPTHQVAENIPVQFLEKRSLPIKIHTINDLTDEIVSTVAINPKTAAGLSIRPSVLTSYGVEEYFFGPRFAWFATIRYVWGVVIERTTVPFFSERKTISSSSSSSITMIVQEANLPPPRPDAVQKQVKRGQDVIIYIHGIDDPTKYIVDSSGGEALFIRSNSHNDNYWTFICETRLMGDETFTIHADNVRKRNSLATTTVSTFSMTPMSIRCTVNLLPSSLFSIDGKARIFITGGIPPYTLIWSDLDFALETTDSIYDRSGMGIGVFDLTILSSDNNQLTCTLTLYANGDNAFHVTSINADISTGCAPSITTTIHATVAFGTPETIGAWNIDTESDIVDCSDGRLTVIADVANIFVVVYGPGTWRTAICSDSDLLVFGEDQFVANTTQPLEITAITDGETCTDPADNVTLITKVAASFQISSSVGVISITKDGITPVDGIVVDDTTVLIDDLVTGLHTIMIEDERECPRFVDLLVNNTGLAVCGDCNISNTDCQDQCKVPYGNNDCLFDCIIDDIETIKGANVSSVLFEATYCLDRNKTLFGNTAEFIFDSQTIVSYGIAANKSFDLINFGYDTIIKISNTALLRFTDCRFDGDTTVTMTAFGGQIWLDGTTTGDTLIVNNNNVVVVVTVADSSNLNFVHIKNGNKVDWIFKGNGHIGTIQLDMQFVAGSNLTNVTVICDYFNRFRDGQFDYLKIGENGIVVNAILADDICLSTGGIVTIKKPRKDKIPEQVMLISFIIGWTFTVTMLTMMLAGGSEMALKTMNL